MMVMVVLIGLLLLELNMVTGVCPNFRAVAVPLKYLENL